MAIFTTDNKESDEITNKSKTYCTSVLGSNSGIDTLLIIDSNRAGFLSNATLLARGLISEVHRRIADNYIIIKKIFGHPVVHCQITDQEKEFLSRYDFQILEFTTGKQMEEEITFLKKWSISRSRELKDASNRIMNIRAKELKHLIATNYVNLTSEIYNGYRVLEKYFENISRYYNKG